MDKLRPIDLAREHGISTQVVRNYERDGYLPPADRSPSGYRTYTGTHAAALRAFLALVVAHGHRTAGQIMTALHRDALADALDVVDRSHARMLRDRETLARVRDAVNHLTAQPPMERPGDTPRTVGELARHLAVTAATLRNWERVGILVPTRDPATGYRRFGPGDVRDAELTHLLRRGGYPLVRIAIVVEQVRSAKGTDALTRALDDQQRALTARGLAMLTAAADLARYLGLRQLR